MTTWKHPNESPRESILIRSRFADIMIKVDEDVYHLDRLILAMKSDYFEKLFTEDFDEKNCNLIELPVMDSNTFSAIVDIMYGKKLESVLTMNNVCSLLMSMDYLQMEIDLEIFVNFVDCHLKDNNPNVEILRLYHFVAGKQDFQILFVTLLNYLSKIIVTLQNHEEFLLLPFDHYSQGVVVLKDDKHELAQIYAKWICHDLENRLSRINDLVNVSSSSFRFSNLEKHKDFIAEVHRADEPMRCGMVRSYIYKMMTYKKEIYPTRSYGECNEMNLSGRKVIKVINPIDEEKKLMKFLKNGNFYDIVIKIEEKTYKLHRLTLNSAASGYFEEIFSTIESSGSAVQGDSKRILLNRDKEHFIDEIDQTSFEVILEYIYSKSKKEKSWPSVNVRLWKAAVILKIDTLASYCEESMRNERKFGSRDIIEVLTFIRNKKQHEHLYLTYLCRYITEMWPEISDEIQFSSISWDLLEEMLTMSDFLFDDPLKILDVCSKWVLHDVENRYSLILRIALAINRGSTIDCDDYKIEIPEDLQTCTQQSIRDKLWEILSSISFLPSSITKLEGNKSRSGDEMPVFIVVDDDDTTHNPNFTAYILNGNLNEVAKFYVTTANHEEPERYLSATVIDDNLFILCIIDNNMSFLAYNVSRKKFFSLAVDNRMSTMLYKKLLNCRDQIYCIYGGMVGGIEVMGILKYSIPLNRWITIVEQKSRIERMAFASNGDEIYRVNCISKKSALEAYSFEENSWTFLSFLPEAAEKYCRWNGFFMVTLNGHPAIVLEFKQMVHVFDYHNDGLWTRFALPNKHDLHLVITETEEGILNLVDGYLYKMTPTTPEWNHVKSVLIDGEERGHFQDLVAVHRPFINFTNGYVDLFPNLKPFNLIKVH